MSDALCRVRPSASVGARRVYQRRQRIADLEQRAFQAEENLELRPQMAVTDERQRIAREMHDVVAHGMSVIAVQAAAAHEIARTDPDKTVEVLVSIETVGRDSLNELRRMLGVLRDTQQSESVLATQPGLDDLADAVAQSIEAGLPTQLVVDGSPRSLPAGLELAAYRIVQEALTNARKHAGDSASAICVLRTCRIRSWWRSQMTGPAPCRGSPRPGPAMAWSGCASESRSTAAN